MAKRGLDVGFGFGEEAVRVEWSGACTGASVSLSLTASLSRIHVCAQQHKYIVQIKHKFQQYFKSNDSSLIGPIWKTGWAVKMAVWGLQHPNLIRIGSAQLDLSNAPLTECRFGCPLSLSNAKVTRFVLKTQQSADFLIRSSTVTLNRKPENWLWRCESGCCSVLSNSNLFKFFFCWCRLSFFSRVKIFPFCSLLGMESVPAKAPQQPSTSFANEILNGASSSGNDSAVPLEELLKGDIFDWGNLNVPSSNNSSSKIRLGQFDSVKVSMDELDIYCSETGGENNNDTVDLMGGENGHKVADPMLGSGAVSTTQQAVLSVSFDFGVADYRFLTWICANYANNWPVKSLFECAKNKIWYSVVNMHPAIARQSEPFRCASCPELFRNLSVYEAHQNGVGEPI